MDTSSSGSSSGSDSCSAVRSTSMCGAVELLGGSDLDTIVAMVPSESDSSSSATGAALGVL